MQCISKKTIDLAIHDIEERIARFHDEHDYSAKWGAECALELLKERIEEEEEKDAEN